MSNFDLSSSSRHLITSSGNDVPAALFVTGHRHWSVCCCAMPSPAAHPSPTHTTTASFPCPFICAAPSHSRDCLCLLLSCYVKTEDEEDMNSPQAITVLPTGDGVISSAGAPSAALALPGLVLHHLPLIQSMVEAVIHRLQEQEHGSDHTAVDSHDHHGWLQGLRLQEKGSPVEWQFCRLGASEHETRTVCVWMDSDFFFAARCPILIFRISAVFRHCLQSLTNSSTALISDSIWTTELTGSISNPGIELKKPQTNLGHQLLNIEISPVCKRPFPGRGTFTEVQ